MTMPLIPMLKFSRRSLLPTAAWIALACPMAFAQGSSASGAASPPTPTPTTTMNATPAPSFDVATIKPQTGMMRFIGLMNTPDGTHGTGTLSMLMQYAYGLLSEDQVTGGPEWVKEDRFDIQAKMSGADAAAMEKLGPADAKARRALMLQALLAERFKLKSHSETKQVPIYELVVAKGGSKLIDAATDPSDKLENGPDGKPLAGMLRFQKETSLAQGYSTNSLADFLSSPVAGVGRPVVDKTGLTGTYDFKLNWSVYTAQIMVRNGSAVGSAAGDDAPSIFDALKEVGLKLQPGTGPIETIVIDHVERPSAD